MNQNVLDFIHAALPWMTIGLLLAVFFARSASRKEEKGERADYSIEGMCIGMCAGSAAGAMDIVSLGTGISLGMLIGLVIGMCIRKDNGEKEG